MCGRLRRVLVCTPATAGWESPEARRGWQALGYGHPPDAAAAAHEHEELRRVLAESGVEQVELAAAPDLSLDAVYVHDASFLTDAGAIPLRMGKAQRRAEPDRQRAALAAAGIPVLGRIASPGTVEAGDLVWLDGSTVLAGRGYRTSDSGIAQLRGLLGPLGVQVVEAPLPHARGPGACLHLMSLLSVLRDDTVLVDPPWLAVSTLELLEGRGFRFIEMEPGERERLACNVLALDRETLVAFEECPRTRRRLEEAGFRVRTVPGRELGQNGGGGPTCLTRPLLRDP